MTPAHRLLLAAVTVSALASSCGGDPSTASDVPVTLAAPVPTTVPATTVAVTAPPAPTVPPTTVAPQDNVALCAQLEVVANAVSDMHTFFGADGAELDVGGTDNVFLPDGTQTTRFATWSPYAGRWQEHYPGVIAALDAAAVIATDPSMQTSIADVRTTAETATQDFAAYLAALAALAGEDMTEYQRMQQADRAVTGNLTAVETLLRPLQDHKSLFASECVAPVLIDELHFA